MLRWDARPDFIQLEQILRDLMRLEDCSELLERLLSKKSGDVMEIYKGLYRDVDSFLCLKKQEVRQ